MAKTGRLLNIASQLSEDDRDLLEGLGVSDHLDEFTAYAALFVFIAQSDGSFSNIEQSIIARTLTSLFSISESEVNDAIATAESLYSSVREPQSFIKVIKKEYSKEEKARLLQAIENVAKADNRIDDFEAYMSNKFASLLEDG